MEILRADTNYRRKAIKVYFMMVVIGIFIIGYVFPEFMSYVEKKPLDERFDIMLNLLEILMLSVLPIGIYPCYYAWAIYKSDQFPPTGHKVIRDTVILRGKAARLKAFVLICCGLVIVFMAILGATYFPSKLRDAVYKSNKSQERTE